MAKIHFLPKKLRLPADAWKNIFQLASLAVELSATIPNAKAINRNKKSTMYLEDEIVFNQNFTFSLVEHLIISKRAYINFLKAAIK
jgi:hypothetical protein